MGADISSEINRENAFHGIQEEIRSLSVIENEIQKFASGLSGTSILEELAQNTLDALCADNVILYRFDQKNDKFIVPPVMKGKFLSKKPMDAQTNPDEIVKSFLKRKEVAFYETNVLKNSLFCNPREDGIFLSRFVVREEIKSCAILKIQDSRKKEVLGLLVVNYRRRMQCLWG